MDRGRETADFGGVTLDGRYRLFDRRPDGSHDGVHLPTGRRVIVRQAPGDTAEAMRLKRTLQRVVGLDHPALVPVLDAGAGESGLYLVEGRIEGESLAELMGHAQPPDRVGDLIRQLTRVLAEAHGRGLFHGALRPESVIIQQTTGRSDYVRLAGIGLSETPFSGGAGPWTAPELRAGEPADARSDLYTVGLMGRALLGGLSPADAVSGPLPGVPPRLLEVLDALCRRSPAQRPPSAVAVLGPIERATSAGGGVGGRAMADTFVATGPLPDVSRFESPPNAGLWASAAPLAAPVYGGVPIDAPVDRAPSGPARRPWAWAGLVALLVGLIVFLLLRSTGPTSGPDDQPATPAAASSEPAAQPDPPAPPDAAPPDAAPPDAAPQDAAPLDAATEADAAVEPDAEADPPPATRARPRIPPARAVEPAAPARPATAPPSPSPVDYEKL